MKCTHVADLIWAISEFKMAAHKFKMAAKIDLFYLNIEGV